MRNRLLLVGDAAPLHYERSLVLDEKSQREGESC